MPVGASSPNRAADSHRPDPAAFTRPTRRPGGLHGRAREHLRRADANARRLVAQLAARPYRALLALTLAGATLLALSWMGLALRNGAAAQHAASRRAAAATSALKHERDLAADAIHHDQTRIATLYGQLEQASVALRQRPAPATSPAAARSRHKPARQRARAVNWLTTEGRPAMSAETANTREVTLVHPDGTIRLRVPIDVPLAELMPEFVDVARQPEDHGWELGRAAGDPYEDPYRTLEELGVGDGDVLVLHAPRSSPATSAEREQDSGPAPALEPRVGLAAGERPLQDRTVQTLPEKLLRGGRWWASARALTGGHPQPERHATAIPGPATFTRPARISPLARAHDAWTRSDYQFRLDELIVSLQLRSCVTIAVVSPKGGVGKSTITALLGSLLAFLRRDRVVAVETNPDWGSLGRRLVPDHPIFIDDLLAGALSDGRLSPTSLDAQLGRGPNGLMIAPAPTDPDRAAKLDEQAYRTLFERLGQLVGTLVLDCGTGLDDPPARGRS